MVTQTTARTSSRSMGATVEMSTPPLMATAIGNSGMQGDPAQLRHAGADGFDEGVHLLDGIAAAEGEAHAGAGAVVTQADGLQNVRRRERSAGAGGAGGGCEAAEVEGDHHGFAIDAVEVELGGVGPAVPARAVDTGAGNAFQHGVLE